MNWWHYNQLLLWYTLDRKTFGFLNKPNTFDFILNAGDKKLLSKMYNYLLSLKVVDEQIKEPMIAWAQISVTRSHCLTAFSMENY